MKRVGLARAAEWVRIDDELSIELRPLSLPEIRALYGQMSGMVEGRELDALDALYAATVELLAEHVRDWTVADPEGKPLPVTREIAEQLLGEEPQLIGAVVMVVMERFAQRLVAASAEKNASAPLPNGSSAGAPATAATARASAPNARDA